MVIDYTGEVLMCAHDWKKEMVIGNINKQNIIEICNSKMVELARKRLSNKSRSFRPCMNCNVAGDVMGE